MPCDAVVVVTAIAIETSDLIAAMEALGWKQQDEPGRTGEVRLRKSWHTITVQGSSLNYPDYIRSVVPTPADIMRAHVARTVQKAASKRGWKIETVSDKRLRVKVGGGW